MSSSNELYYSDQEDSNYSENFEDSLNRTKSEEHINRVGVVTRSGRNSKPPEFFGVSSALSDSILDNVVVKPRLKKHKARSQLQEQSQVIINTIMAQPGIQMTDAQFVQLIERLNTKSGLTAVLAENSLPKFKGRRRENERPFEQSQTFTEFIDSVNAHIASQKLSTDEEKINFLLVCADKSAGDFFDIVREYKSQAQFSGSTFNDIVEHLREIYATNKEKTLFDSNREVLAEGNKPLTSRYLVPSRLNGFHTAQENSLKFYLEGNTIAVPERNAGESDADFFARCDKFKAELIRDFNLKLFFGTKFTPAINNKIFNAAEMRNRQYKDTILKVHQVLRETPSASPVLVGETIKNSEMDTFVTETHPEYEFDDFETGTCQYCLDDNLDHTDCETFYSSHHRGSRYNYRGHPSNFGRSRPLHARRPFGDSYQFGRGAMSRGHHIRYSDGKPSQQPFRGLSKSPTRVTNRVSFADRGSLGNFRNRTRFRGRYSWRKFSPVQKSQQEIPIAYKTSEKHEGKLKEST